MARSVKVAGVGAAVSADTVTAARHQFFSQHKVPETLVSRTILKSWIRCSQLGHDVVRGPAFEPLGAPGLRERREQHERLRRLCLAEMQALRREARATGGIVVLSDADGMVLDAAGDTAFAGKAAGVALRPGVAWSEASIGTNAIGTALVERRPIMVRGGEHFHEAHRLLTCAAAPIFDPTGAIVGALDLSGSASAVSPHSLSMVRLVIDQIEHRMFDGLVERHPGAGDLDILRFHAEPSVLGTVRECILVFEGERLVAANRHALKALARDWDAVGSASFDALFEGGARSLDERGTLRMHSGEVAHYELPRRRVAVSVPPAREAAPVRELAARPRFPAPVPWPEPAFDTQARIDIENAIRLVDADIPLLVNGETGAGKEAFARAVHAGSRCADKPFIAVNCAAIPESLIESELFGYEEGAFTGARRQGSRGLLREADGGILFLDEIGDMPLPLQSRLLRVLQDRQVVPLGGARSHPIDIRVISATHRDIEVLSRQGEFRADLYYRLAQFTMSLRPLRARDDLLALVGAMWRQVAPGAPPLPEGTLAAMTAHDWPGNYRELVGMLRALAALATPGVPPGPHLLPAALRRLRPASEAAAPADAGLLHHHTRDLMRATLDACGGNISLAARKLGVNRSTLYRNLQRLQ